MSKSTSDPHRSVPSILRLWLRPVEGGEPEEQDLLQLDAGHGIVGDHTYGRLRHVTLLFLEDWRAAEAELGRTIDPKGRRANLLLSGGNAPHYQGRTIQLGEVVVEIKGISTPCPVMEKAAVGLMQALRPAGRGGVWGRVLQGGAIRRGDPLRIVETHDPSSAAEPL